MDACTFVKLYKSFVRPHLEYGNVVWSPLYKRQSAAIERVQRRATKVVRNIRNMSYTERLSELNLPTLKFRRIRGDLIQAFKIFKGVDNLDSEKFFTLHEYEKTRNPTNKIFIKFSRTNMRKNSFSNRVAPYWNMLPAQVKDANNTNSFKSLLDSVQEINKHKYIFDK